MKFDIEKNKKEFLNRLDSIKRPGIEKLKKYLAGKNSDFFDAPYSTEFLAVKGGLCHFVLVFMDVLVEKFNQSPYQEYREVAGLTEENLAVVALLSGLDRVNYFGQEMRNQQIYDKEEIEAAKTRHETIKRDEEGKEFFWGKRPGYVIKDTLPLGGGARAIAIAQAYITLRKEELMALRWHDQAPYETKGTVNSAYGSAGLLSAIHEAKTVVRHVILNDAFADIYAGKYGVPSDEDAAPAATEAKAVPDIELPDEPQKKEEKKAEPKAQDQKPAAKQDPPAEEKKQEGKKAADEKPAPATESKKEEKKEESTEAGESNMLSNLQELLKGVDIPDDLPFEG